MKAQKLLFLTICILFSCSFLWGQNEQSTLRKYLNKGDSIIHARYSVVDYDTNYIKRPKGKFLAKIYGNLSGVTFDGKERESIDIDDVDTYYRVSGKFRTSSRKTISLGLTYQGITAGFTINPSSFSGHQKGEVELGFNAYTNKIVFDVNYCISSTFSGTMKINKIPFMTFEKGDMKIKMLNISGYYAFNNKRFSFPAAFSQTYVQRKPAGSILAGFGIQMVEIKALGEFKEFLEGDWTNHMRYYGLGVGYGYNLVFDEGKWLIHASILPNVVVYNVSTTRYDGTRSKSHDKFPVFIMNEHFALVHFFGEKINFFGARYLAGITFEQHDVLYIRNHSDSSQSKWQWRFFIGARF